MLGDALQTIAPRLLWRYRIWRWGIDAGEAEQRLLPQLCRRSQWTIDVGAADGAYTAKSLVHSAGVLSFEPRPDAAKSLRELFRTRLVAVEEIALSDVTGKIGMRVPQGRPMLATIESSNTLENAPTAHTVTVATRPLDSYGFTSVGFIKIDVEGHEAAVLRGARETIERSRPNVMVEIEERHNPGSFQTVSDWFACLDYEGYFLLDRDLVPLARFQQDRHQNPANLLSKSTRVGIYINNFIFLSKGTPQKPAVKNCQSVDL